MAKAKGRKAKSTRSTVPKRIVPDPLPPATQAEMVALNPDRGFDRIPVLEPTANVPYVTPEQLAEEAKGPKAKAAQKARAEQEKIAKQQQEAADVRAKADAKARDEAAKDKEKRGVEVVALRKGFYPHDGRLRHPGETFTYHLHRDPRTKKVEDSLPSWMQHVEGKIPTRETDELSTHDENFFRASGAAPTPFVGAVPAATVPARGGGSSVI